jgi:hypothetical protein
MQNISKRLYKISTGWVSLTTLVIFLIFMAAVLPRQAAKAERTSGGMGSPDTTFFYSVKDLYHMAEKYGEAGRKAYIQARFSFDLLFPLVYTAFLCTSISWTARRAFPLQSKWQLANLAPVFGMTFDFLENITASLVMARYPNMTPVVDWLAPIFSITKWIFVYGSFVILLASISSAVYRRISTKNSNH